MSLEIRPKPCFICGELPMVKSFVLIASHKRVWTAACPNRHHETDAYYDRDGAIDQWNAWCEPKGYVFYDELLDY